MFKRFLYIFIVILILLFLPLAISKLIRDRSTKLFSPLTSVLVRKNIELVNFYREISQIPSLRTENQNLQNQVANLQQALAHQADILRENTVLKNELSVVGSTQNSPKVLANVILEGVDPNDRTLTINAGTQNGIRVGQPAVYQGYLVGKVISTSESTSLIRLITSPQSNIQAWIVDSHAKGLLTGTGNSASLNDILQGVNVAPGSLVETDGLGGSLPQGILIGQIGQIESAQSQPSQNFVVNLGQDPTSLDSLFILINN
jgi:rod shape-determining protein MreC